MINTTLMFTIAQVSATFVAIIAGFYTAKIISISGERQRIQNKIAEIDAELRGHKKIADHYQASIDEHFAEEAKKNVNDFVQELLTEDELKEYTLEEIFAKYKELEFNASDEDEQEVLKNELPNINQKIRKELKKREPKSYANLPFGLADTLGTIDAVRPAMTRASLVSGPVSLAVSQQRNDFLKDAASKRDNAHAKMRILIELKKHHTEELKAVTYPKHIAFGYATLVTLAITGVIIPLVYGSMPDRYDDSYNLAVILMFAVSLGLILGYIFSELVRAIRGDKKQQKTEPDKQQPAKTAES